MSAFFAGIGVIVSLELRQRVRTVAWFVLLGVFFALVALVTVFLKIAFSGFGADNSGGAIFSAIIYFVLLLGTLVAPALSGNAINGDRDAGTLATTQVTLVTTWQIILGKFLAAWVTALAFLAVAVPFLLYAALDGGISGDAIVVSVLVLAVELGVVAAIGVGLSGILTRPLFSVAVTYLVVAALSVGTLIAFTLGGLSVQSDLRTTTSYATSYSSTGQPELCGPPQTTSYPVPRFDYFWGVLVANPYVLLADAVPTAYSAEGYPTDLFGNIKLGVRQAQLAPELTTTYDECAGNGLPPDSARQIIERTTPGWSVGLIIHLVLASGALVWAWSRTRTPAARLARGSRVA